MCQVQQILLQYKILKYDQRLFLLAYSQGPLMPISLIYSMYDQTFIIDH